MVFVDPPFTTMISLSNWVALSLLAPTIVGVATYMQRRRFLFVDIADVHCYILSLC